MWFFSSLHFEDICVCVRLLVGGGIGTIYGFDCSSCAQRGFKVCNGKHIVDVWFKVIFLC